MAWVYLVLAGGLEVFWSTFMKLSEGFSKPGYTVLTLVGMAASFILLAQATKVLPLGTSYAIWTGIGALGAVIVGIVLSSLFRKMALIYYSRDGLLRPCQGLADEFPSSPARSGAQSP